MLSELRLSTSCPVIASTHRIASAIASATVAGPLTASPAINTPGLFVTNVSASTIALPFSSISIPSFSNIWLSTWSPTAAMTVSAWISSVRPVATGLRLPDLSGAPNSICSQTSFPSFSLTGARSSLNSTSSPRANCSSSPSAGIYLFVRR
jgi:hypothetical protein